MHNPNLMQGATVITTGSVYAQPPPPVYPADYANKPVYPNMPPVYPDMPPAYQQTFQAQAGPKY
jgi:hypothetical protein